MTTVQLFDPKLLDPFRRAIRLRFLLEIRVRDVVSLAEDK